MRKAVMVQLHEIGMRNFVEARNGEEALEILSKNPIDVVLANEELPKMSGLELLQAVRKNLQFAQLPFLLITASVNKSYVVDAIRNGVSNILMKPYNLQLLTKHIENSISHPIKSVPFGRSESTTLIEKSTILIVDDMPDNLKLLANIFKKTYRVQVAQNGAQALEICTSENAPDLVLLDIMMPDMDGFEVAIRMRQHPNSEHIPIIFVTAMDDDDVRLKGMKLGAMDFITQPIVPNAIKIRVDNFMRYVELYKNLQSNYDGMLENAKLKEAIENISRQIQTLNNDDSLNSSQIEQLRHIQELALSSFNR